MSTNLHAVFPVRSFLRFNRSKSIVEGEDHGRFADATRMARHSDAMLEGMSDRGPLRIPTDRLNQQRGTVSAESLVEQVGREMEKCE